MKEPLAYRGPTPPDPNRQSGWGIASFVCSCLVAASLAAAAILGAFGGSARGGREEMTTALLGLVGAWALAVLFGIVSLLRYDRAQGYAAWGLILAAVTGPLLLITAGLVWGRFN